MPQKSASRAAGAEREPVPPEDERPGSSLAGCIRRLVVLQFRVDPPSDERLNVHHGEHGGTEKYRG